MKSYYSKDFLLDMIREVTDQIKNGNLSLIRREEIPEGSIFLPGVWKMNRNRDIKTSKIKK